MIAVGFLEAVAWAKAAAETMTTLIRTKSLRMDAPEIRQKV
jgi:hypothetical protein